jgi:hypothetical protein
MLEEDYRSTLNQLLEKLECHVQVPDKWDDFYDRRGPMPATSEDRRRFARLHCPGRAVLQMETTLPAIERGQQVHCVLTKDISRGGLSFLHTEQLFPEERIKLWLPIGKHDALIVRCQRRNENCYEIGAVFTSLGHDSSERAQGAMA